MDILNKDKLKQVLERWKGHPSVTDLMDRLSYAAAMQATHRAGVQGNIAIAYTV